MRHLRSIKQLPVITLLINTGTREKIPNVGLTLITNCSQSRIILSMNVFQGTLDTVLSVNNFSRSDRRLYEAWNNRGDMILISHVLCLLFLPRMLWSYTKRAPWCPHKWQNRLCAISGCYNFQVINFHVCYDLTEHTVQPTCTGDVRPSWSSMGGLLASTRDHICHTSRGSAMIVTHRPGLGIHHCSCRKFLSRF